jgi:trimeric autotransporter adhesin
MKYSNFHILIGLFMSLLLSNIAIKSYTQINNHFAGNFAGNGNTGSENTAVGDYTLQSLNSGNLNCAFGVNALSLNVTGYDNSSFGGRSMFYNYSGWLNGAFGRSALENNSAGTQNYALGAYSLLANTTASDNIGIGVYSLLSNTTGSGNIAIGYMALQKNNGSGENIAIGYYALSSDAGPYIANVAVGNLSLGYSTAGSLNTAIGESTLLNNTESSNTVIGNKAGMSNTLGDKNTYIGWKAGSNGITGYYNSAIGKSALEGNISGAKNTAIGNEALYLTTSSGNTALGDVAGSIITTGANNTCIGTGSNLTLGSLNEASAFGYLALSNASNKIVIGQNVAGTVIGGYAAWSNLSDGRFKEDIKKDVPGLNFINALEPVTYVVSLEKLDKHLTQMMPDSVARKYFKTEEEYAYNQTIRHTGFIAQDVEKAAEKLGYEFDGVNKPTNPTDNYSLSYSTFVVPMVQAVKELDSEELAKDQRIAQLEADLNEMKTIMVQMQEHIGKLNENNWTNAEKESFFTLSPNPSDGLVRLKINSSALNQIFNIRISDMKGNEIQSMTARAESGPVQINTQSWAKGSYAVQVMNGQQSLGAQVLVVE